MSIPGTLYQLAVLLVLVMPGIVYAAVRHQLRGPVPEDRDVGVRVLRAMMVSAGLDFTYALAFGPTLRRLTLPKKGAAAGSSHLTALVSHPRAAGLWGLILVFAIPAVLGFLLHGLVWNQAKPRVTRRRGNSPIPSAWDWANSRRGNCFVRLRLHDGRFVGGWLGESAFSSMHPETRDLFVDVQWQLDTAGQFLHATPRANGMYIDASQADIVEWLAPTDAPPAAIPGSVVPPA